MRILIVEDEVGISSFVKQGLEEESFVVDTAADGNQGLILALSNDYDLLLLDWMLPGLSGIEICRQFRKENSATPIIFLTAKDTVQETIFGLQSGANDYIKKPFHFEELLERIRVQLRSTPSSSEKLSIGNIVLDVNAHQVHKGNEEIFLTKKEFALLEYLLRNKNKVCRRTRIIESVWDIHFEYNTGVIDVYINALRNKLKLSEAENYIQTVRGIGYIAKEL
ncbi:DNA-binding response OmpR family regulator [Roseivirga ehrenbergii]|uniref:Transcriptional regulator n=2 Tax=Roseivirga TaxID=290180 RepID=A0A0L8AL52_9BACT|nr:MULTISPECIES: response regulator transcription factor [Roseivirga]KOF03183.1 transcriptional regulator [Roseivirga seohaensis subsp. aquiponti]KYG71728.1 two-component system response regulator [Roseivirga ehrenbergii]TCL07578.1 DNA-binding response OmpR family regulator [Roseivirga ehrenbergii]